MYNSIYILLGLTQGSNYLHCYLDIKITIYYHIRQILYVILFKRLNFYDLRNDTGLNNLSPEEKLQIWIPELVFDNTEFKPSTVADAESSGTIKVVILLDALGKLV